MANHEEQCNCDQAIELRKLLVEAKQWIENLEGMAGDEESCEDFYDPELVAFRDRLDKSWAFKEPKP